MPHTKSKSQKEFRYKAFDSVRTNELLHVRELFKYERWSIENSDDGAEQPQKDPRLLAPVVKTLNSMCCCRQQKAIQSVSGIRGVHD